MAEVGAGDIAGVAKLSETTTGDTLSDKDKPTYSIPSSSCRLFCPWLPGQSPRAMRTRSGRLARLQEEDPTLRTPRKRRRVS